jgi:hypothetical protein
MENISRSNAYYKFVLLFVFSLLASLFAPAQTKVMPEYDLNKNYPGATYKFSFIHITDTHVGEGGGDYGTTGFYNDTMPVGDVGEPAQRLRTAVNWINANYEAKNIKFVIVSGDLTDSGEKSEFEKFKEIMSACKIPYVPLMGNHDTWPYVRYQFESEKADGDSVINEVFKDVYDSCKHFFQLWNDGTRLTQTLNPETNNYSFLQNFYFEYDGFLFMALDFNPRYHVVKDHLTLKPAPGIGPEAQVMDWDGGTFRWMEQALQTMPDKGIHNIILYSHHPPTQEFFAPFYGFDKDEYTKISNLLFSYKQNMGMWLAGHIHRERLYKIATVDNKDIMPVYETAANKIFESGQLKIVNVYEISNATPVFEHIYEEKTSLYPNPNAGIFYLEAETFEPGAKMDVVDATGKLLRTEKIYPTPSDNYRLDFSGLPKGLYYITITDKYQSHTEPLVIQ